MNEKFRQMIHDIKGKSVFFVNAIYMRCKNAPAHIMFWLYLDRNFRVGKQSIRYE